MKEESEMIFFSEEKLSTDLSERVRGEKVDRSADKFWQENKNIFDKRIEEDGAFPF